MRSLIILLIFIFLNGLAQAQKPILIQNQYFPKEGKELEVYALRLRASEIREGLGLNKGVILKRQNGNNRPYVIWQFMYSSLDERERDVEKMGLSEEFNKVQDSMKTILDHFERVTWDVAD